MNFRVRRDLQEATRDSTFSGSYHSFLELSSHTMSDLQQIGNIVKCSRNVSFEWEITDFFSYNEENVQYFSPEFQVLNSIWCVAICPNHIVLVNNKSTSYVSLYVCNVSENSPESVELQLGIKASNDKICFKREKTISDKTKMTVGWHQFIEKIRIELQGKELVPSGTLTVTCSIRIEEPHNYSRRPEKLVEDLKHMFSGKKNSDVVLKIKGDTISAHKAILSARSSVFAAMFENDMEEKKTGVVNISDCDLEPFNVFLHYIYTGEAEFSKCDVFHLYKIADKYGVPELMMMCLGFMICSLSVENIFETFVFGKQLDEIRLLTHIQHFFNKNFEKIVFSDSWKSFLAENTGLANELLKGMAPKIQLKPS